MKISIIIPVFNERDSINQLYKEIISGINNNEKVKVWNITKPKKKKWEKE